MQKNLGKENNKIKGTIAELLGQNKEEQGLQKLINSGSAWKLEGYIGRACMDAITGRLENR